MQHFIKIIDNKRKLVIASVKFSLQLVLMLFLSLVVVFVFDEFIKSENNERFFSGRTLMARLPDPFLDFG